jgi:hypothetical protein
MADLVSTSTGNLTASGTWNLVGHSLISTSTSSTGLTTGNLDSATFVPAATAIIGMCVRVAQRTPGAASNTMTITLRNSTTATNIGSVTVNISDIPGASNGTDSEGGWFYLKLSASHTPNGTDSYLIRATVSSTTPSMQLATNGTANNWQRMIVLTTNQAPAAGDDMHVCGTFDGSTNPATLSTTTVTMNQTAATDYGTANTSTYVAALDISKGGTLTWGTSASTNYLLRLSGQLKVYAGGTYNMGTVGTPIPRTSTAQLEFDCAADGDFGFRGMNLSTVVIQGLSRTSGKNIAWTLLTADLAAAGTSSTVQDDTGWLNGDEVAIASTSRTHTESESVTLSANAGASSLSHGAVTNAHGGSASTLVQAEVILLTRNVILRSVSTTAMSHAVFKSTSSVDADWALFRYMGGAAGVNNAITVETTSSGSASFSYCCLRDVEHTGFAVTGSSCPVVIEYCVGYNLCTVSTPGIGLLNWTGAGTPAGTVTQCVAIQKSGINSNGGFRFGANMGTSTLTYLRSCTNWWGFNIDGTGDFSGVTMSNWVAHSCSLAGLYCNGPIALRNATFANMTFWRAGGTSGGIHLLADMFNVTFTTTLLFGNTQHGVLVSGAAEHLHFYDLRAYADTTFTTLYGIRLGTALQTDVRVLKGDFGTASGIYTTHTNADVGITSFGPVEAVFNYCKFGSSTEIETTGGILQLYYPSRLHIQRRDQTATQHLTKTNQGDITYETSTVDVSPSIKLTPLNATATLKLDTAASERGRGFLSAVSSGSTVTPTVKVQKDGSYNGNAPRLILKANPALGVDTDQVLDTLTVAAGNWETLTGTTPSATDDGVFEFVVDCDGTAGNVFVDTFAGGNIPDGAMRFWKDGLAVGDGTAVIPGGVPSPSTQFAHVFVGGPL